MEKQGLRKRGESVGFLGSILQIFVSVFTLSSVIGLVTGVIFSYLYLFKIGYLSILPDVLAQPSVLVAVLISISIYSFFYLLQLLSPYAFYLNINSIIVKRKIKSFKIIYIYNFISYLIFTTLFFFKLYNSIM